MSEKKPVKKVAKAKSKPKSTAKKPKNMNMSKAQMGNQKAVGHGEGRPTKYKPEFVDQLNEFFSMKKDAFREVETAKGVQLIPRRMPTFERFAWMIGVDDATLWAWSVATKKDSEELLYPDFHNAYSRAKSCQRAFMIEGGVVGALNPSFSGLLMKNLHDWKDKTESEVTHAGSIDMTQVDADLKTAADERLRKKKEMKEMGLTGKFET